MSSSGGFPTGEPANANVLPVVKSIFDVSAEFLGQYKTWLEQNPPSIPVTQIVGFSQFTVQEAPSVLTAETTTSLTYTDLATTGPTLSSLPDGKYLIIFGAYASTSNVSNAAWMSVQVNSTGAVDNDAAAYDTTTGVPGVRGIVKTLSNGGNNTLTAKYRVDGGSTGAFARRWMIALRVSNS